MARFFRIVQAKWAATAMDGEGARQYGGRWNPVGMPAVYLAESRALAALEILVHAPRELLALEWRVIAVDLPDSWMERVEVAHLPPDWREQPSSSGAKRMGGEWLRQGKAVALRLPSVIVPQEHTILLNPLHAQAGKWKCGEPEPFVFDLRLGAKG